MLEEHFREQLQELVRMCPKGRQTMLFSATMTDEVIYFNPMFVKPTATKD